MSAEEHCQPGGEGTCEIQRADDGTLDFSDYGTVPVTIDYPAKVLRVRQKGDKK